MPGRRRRFFYGWVVLATSIYTIALIYSLKYSFSFLFVALLDEFGWKRADTAAIFSLNLLAYGLMLPLGGALVDRWGPRRAMTVGLGLVSLSSMGLFFAQELWHVYLLFGVTLAVGLALSGWVPNSTVASNWFVRRRGMVLGVLGAGIGGTYIFASLTQYLIFGLGWRLAYVLMGGVIATLVLPAVLLVQRHRPQDMGLRPDGEGDDPPPSHPQVRPPLEVVDPVWAARDWSLPWAMQTLRFWSLFLANFLVHGIGLTLIMAHHIAYMRDIGFSTGLGALVYLAYGVAFTVGNLSAFISDRIGRETAYTLGSIVALSGLLLLIAAGYFPSPWLLFLYAAGFGGGLGLLTPVLVAAVADLFQGRHFGAINGFTTMGFGVGGAISPWLGGYIFDRVHSYTPAFLVVAGAMTLACFAVWWAAPRRVRRPAR